jgi:hypothetical protein
LFPISIPFLGGLLDRLDALDATPPHSALG